MDIQITQIIFQVINFSVVVGALSVLLYKPVLKILEERAAKIAEAQKQAEATLAQQASLTEMKQKATTQAKKEAAQIVEEAKQTAQAQAEKIIQEAKSKSEQMLIQSRENWAAEKQQQQKALKDEFAVSVVAVSRKVMGEVFDEKTHTKLIDKELTQLLKLL